MKTYEEKVERVKDFRPIDDVFFEVLADDNEVCQEILRTIMEDEALIVEDVIVQRSLRNIYGRSVRLDALCTLGDGTRCNIEVQRGTSDDHLKRARYNAACIITKNTEPGERFENIPRVIIVYISEMDFLGYGKTIYHIDKVIRENGQVVDDGLLEVFVNTCVDDGTDIADLMRCFMQKEIHNPRFPKLSSRMRYLKEEKGGISIMCEIMEQYMSEAKEEGRKAGWEEGKKEGLKTGRQEGLEAGRIEGRQEAKRLERLHMIQNMLRQGFEKETILSLTFTDSEYEEARESLTLSV